MKKVLIVVDYQNDFAMPGSPLYVPEAETIADNISNKINDNTFDNIIYTMDTHIKKDYENSFESTLFPIHCEINSKGWDFYKITPKDKFLSSKIKKAFIENKKTEVFSKNESIFIKDQFDIWNGNKNYKDFFTSNFDKDTEIYIVGVATNYCVFMNAMGYIENGYNNVFIFQDSIKGIKDETYQTNINVMKNRGIKFI